MKVIIAEKPSVAKDIAAVLNVTQKNDGYIEGNGYQITWAFGHLVGLADPKVYGHEKWSLAALPILPDQFFYELKNDAGARKQFKIIKTLFENCSEIICATDAGREGEAIFRYIYNETKCNKPFKRLWISSLTAQAIKEGFQKLQPGSRYNDLYYSAKARNEADWLVGINATRAVTLSSGATSPLSLGRVQTPTLALICERYKEHTAFKPTPFWKIRVKLEKDGKLFFAYYKEPFTDKLKGENLIGVIGKEVSTMSISKKEKIEKAPLPFDLTSLQSEANRRYKFKAQKTLDLMQKLYEEHKLLTYPRTSSRYLGQDMIEGIQKKIGLLSPLNYSSNYNEALKLLSSKIETACFDDTKLSDHHAIIPTFFHLDKVEKLSADERKIFDMVAQQLIMSLLPACKKEVLTYKFYFSSDYDNLVSSGTTITSAGWRIVQQDEIMDDDSEEDTTDQSLPVLQKGDKCSVMSRDLQEKMTKKPPLYTEASLLDVMKSAGKLVDEKELKDALSDCGLGTAATRAAIIETLYSRNYIVSEKNKISPTEIGLQIYDLVKGTPLAHAATTGDWELKLNQMAENKYDFRTFLDEMKEFTTQEVKRLIEEGKHIKTSALDDVFCPICGKSLIQNQKAYGCSGHKEGCTFVIWKEIGGKKITDDIMRQLVTDKETKVIKGFKNKDGKVFDAKLKFDAAQQKIVYAFDAPEQKDLGKCPICGKALIQNQKAYGCSGYKEGCTFVVWKEIASKKISEEVVRQLVSNKETKVIKGFKSKVGKAFDAKLILDPQGKVSFKL